MTSDCAPLCPATYSTPVDASEAVDGHAVDGHVADGHVADGHAVLVQAPGLECSVLTGTSVSSLQLRGELDLESADLLTALVDDQIAHQRHDMYVDLTQVTFCDVTGLAALDQARRSAQQAGGQLLMRGASDLLQRIAPIYGIDGLFEDTTPPSDVQP